MWIGNTSDVKTPIPMAGRMHKRFGIHQFCIVADRGMISNDTAKELEQEGIPYILGVRMRIVKKSRQKFCPAAVATPGVYLKGVTSKGPSPLKVKQVVYNGRLKLGNI